MTGPAEAGTPSGIAFSSEKAGQAGKASHGIEHVEKVVGQPTPPIYSAEASLYVLRAGAALIERGLADLLYFSTTDFVQHSSRPKRRRPLILCRHRRVARPPTQAGRGHRPDRRSRHECQTEA